MLESDLFAFESFFSIKIGFVSFSLQFVIVFSSFIHLFKWFFPIIVVLAEFYKFLLL